jgi:hypothetical protein
MDNQVQMKISLTKMIQIPIRKRRTRRYRMTFAKAIKNEPVLFVDCFFIERAE